MVARIASGIAFLFFAMSVGLQYNDPDPLYWVAIYGCIAALSLAAACNRYFPRVTGALALIYMALVVWMAPNFVHTSFDAFAAVGMQSEQQELVRETWGLAICFAWTATLAWYALRRNRAAVTRV